MSGVYSFTGRIYGTTDWSSAADSDIVVITSGIPRKPGLSRDDLMAANAKTVKDVAERIVNYCPNAYIIVVCNPLDAMVAVAGKISGFPMNRVMGMAGVLDSARFAYFVAQELKVNAENIHSILIGDHGDGMVPLPRYTSVGGIPLPELIDSATIQRLMDLTRNGGIEIVNLLGHSAGVAPAAAVVRMAEAIIQDKKTILSCCVWCDNQYNINGAYVGVPVVLGANGVEKIIELNLTDEEQAKLNASVAKIKMLVEKVNAML
jgi:malate dehydrogenase